MAGGTRGFRVTADSERMRRVANELRAVNAAFPRRFRKQLEQVVKPLVNQARARIRSMPTHGARHSGLRRRIARGTRASVATGGTPHVSVVVRMKDPEEKNIPAYIDRRQGWRHPVFGNRNVWVRQESGISWFKETMQDGKKETRSRLIRVINDAVDSITRAGS